MWRWSWRSLGCAGRKPSRSLSATLVSMGSASGSIGRPASQAGAGMREDLKTRAAERTVMIPDIALPAARRLVDRGAPGREGSDGRLFGRLINGDRSGYLGYATWRKYLKLAQG